MDLEKDSIKKDSYTLLNGMFATQLPPLLDNLINENSSSTLLKEISEKPKETLFKVNGNTELLTSLSDQINPPKNIYGNNWAAESIKFFTFKIDNSWRPMAIPNIKHALMFTYNSLIVAKLALNKLYSQDKRLNGETSHSESPIIGRDGMFSVMLYDTEILEDEAVGFIGYNDTNKFFKESKLQRFKMESTYPYILQLDLSKFFENIYTHLLAQIDPKVLGFSSENTILRSFFYWLDQYNQKINDNHTKGIIQGPISSKISAELFQLSLDQYIQKLIQVLSLDVHFTRYVDDYRFFAKKGSDLELLKHHLIKLFRKYELSFNDAKSKIYKGFEVQKQAHLNEYPEIKSLTEGQISKFSFENYTTLRDTIISLLADEDIPTIKAVLTSLKKQFSKKRIKFENRKIVISLVRFLIKVAYVKLIIAERIYRVISSIVFHVKADIKRDIWEVLFEEMEYIEDNFSDTDLEVWYFYVLANIGNSDNTSKVFTQYKRNRNKKELNVLVLTVLLKTHSKQTNTRIETEILSSKPSGLDDDKYWDSISQSKWWLPISKLWVVSNRKVDNKLKNLFISSHNHKIQWDKLGLIEFLLQNR